MKSIPYPTHSLGYPRIGDQRQLKRAVEAFWSGQIAEAELRERAAALRREHWLKQQRAGIDLIPSNDFSFYDQMLDMTALVGAVPERFGWSSEQVDLATYFRIARGNRDAAECCGNGHALEMTKWFDTNYHYLVPELHRGQSFRLGSTKPFDEFAEALALDIKTKPVLIGPVTYLLLSKTRDEEAFDPLALLGGLLPIYAEVLQRLVALGAEWVQLDEPVLALDLTDAQRAALLGAYRTLSEAVPGLRLLVATYFGDLRQNLSTLLALPVAGVHFDVTRAEAELDTLLAAFPGDKVLSLGFVDGRNIWKNDFAHSFELLVKAKSRLGPERLWLAPSCSLLHVPVTLRSESKLDPELRGWLAFADEKLAEVVTLARVLRDEPEPLVLSANRQACDARRASGRIHNRLVSERLAQVSAHDTQRKLPFAERSKIQRSRLSLPLFPTTTIGSFPQTDDVRSARARWKKGELADAEYESFLESKTAEVIASQEKIGLDVLVHGEFERNDMVEYFGEQLDGFAFTENGWVQSYGSRCVKPPIIFGDVSRPQPMTVRWSSYAQSLTTRPMKGMLTGPVTMLQWSFVRDDQPRSVTTRQIALALRDEVLDLEGAGIGMIQIDEPALREGLPLRRQDWKEYLKWAVEAFRLCAGGVRDETQIHTHMCYCEFNDIIDSIAALDADVISIETSRSNMELLTAFEEFSYPAEVGPGVWDIHSPRVPSADEMAALLRRACAVLPAEHVWANPDCGLKTRGWQEVLPALEHMVEAARRLRREHQS